jgi:hypothetical protein
MLRCMLVETVAEACEVAPEIPDLLVEMICNEPAATVMQILRLEGARSIMT